MSLFKRNTQGCDVIKNILMSEAENAVTQSCDFSKNYSMFFRHQK
jgi:hypothetical protein